MLRLLQLLHGRFGAVLKSEFSSIVEMSSSCGLASMQHQAWRIPQGQDCMTLDMSSKKPSCHAWLMKRSHFLVWASFATGRA